MTAAYFIAHSLAHFNLPDTTSQHAIPRTLVPGSEFRVDAALIQACRDRNGWSFLDLIDDEAEQTRRWGSPRFRRGPAPAGLYEPDPNSYEGQRFIQAERDAILAMPESPDKRTALEAWRRKYSAAPSSRTLAEYR